MFITSLLKGHLKGLATQRQTRDQLEALQIAKFRTLVAHCAKHSSYYRDIIAERGIDPATCLVEDFPVLDKSTVIANYDRIVTDPAVTWAKVSAFAAQGGDDQTLMDGRYQVIHTSGTSGETGYFVFSGDDWARGLAPALRINPFRGRRRRLAFYGIVNDHGAGAGMAMTSNRGLVRLAYKARAFDILKPVNETLAEINRFKPDILVGYPTALSVLADAQRARRIDIKPSFLQCSGEVVFPQHREAIEKAFGQPLINVYSTSEHLILGMSRGGGEDMMLFEENFVFEPLGDHTLITNLCNYTLPLIRYRMNDRLVPGRQPAGDTKPYRRIKEIVGRSEGGDLIFHTPGGREERITSFAFGSLSWKHAERIQFHVGPRACRLDIVPEPGLSAEATDDVIADSLTKLRVMFIARGLSHIDITVRVVDTIEPDPATGKVRAVVFDPALVATVETTTDVEVETDVEVVAEAEAPVPALVAAE
jgi:phenylacetate-coenzyme A ligase PaaK-like adenylate-forming protein